jgi:hypothetical protein
MLGVYFFALSPFSEAGSMFRQPPLLSVCYDGLLFVFLILWGQFGFGCCSLVQQMNSVIHYLPFFRE